MKIHHTAICVDDIASAIDWYCQKLNFEVEYQDDSWAFLLLKTLGLRLFYLNNTLISPLSQKGIRVWEIDAT